MVAVVGTRRPTGAGVEAAARIATGLAEAGWVVVSGLAVGIDAAAHRAALEAGGHTVAVLGCGLDVDYPRANAELKSAIASEGTLLSEHALGAPPARRHFPARNRIIAGISLGIVVIEGALQSGALVTARLALDMDRSVYALPGSWRNPMAAGPNELIRTSRAALVTDVAHVFEDLAPALAWSHQRLERAARALRQSCTPEERAVLRALDESPLSPDALARVVGIPGGALAATLSKLEVRGLVARERAGYVLCRAGARALS
jgi:DNA processing protein